MFRKIYFLCFFLLLALLLPCQNYALAHGKDGNCQKQDGCQNQKKKPKTITITVDQFEQLMNKLNSLQNQVDNLNNDLETIKGEKPEHAASACTETPSKAIDKKDKDKHKTDDHLLRKLQKEMGKCESEVPVTSATAVGDTKMNPNITVTGDFVWNINHNKDRDGGSPFDLREIGVEFQSNIDPWSSAKIAVGVVNEDGEYKAGIEEAFISYHKLPLGMKAKAGQFFLPFGKDNELHQHSRPYVDVPNVVENFLEPGNLPGTGVMLSALLPTGNVYTEVMGSVINDQSSRSFTEGASGKPLYFGRIRSFFDVNDSSNIELGYSHLRGFNDEDATRLTRINGVDLTYRWRPVMRGKYQSLMLRGEYLQSRRSETGGVINSKGYYGLAQYQMNRNWYIGGRYDFSEFPDLVNARERAYSAFLTYFPTEFAYYRLQYKNTRRNFAPNYRQLMFQVNFMMGPHGAHSF
jgi:hypothetical protein